MHLRILFLVIFLTRLSQTASICYYPNGDTSTDVPCDPDAPVTPCCATRSACLTSGLCARDATHDTGQSYLRSACTDRSWASPLCPPYCQLNHDTPTNSSAYDFRSGNVQIWECNHFGYGTEAEYCCESTREALRCCSTETVVFTLASATLGPYTGGVSSIPSLSLSSPSLTGSGVASTTLMSDPSRIESATQTSLDPTAGAPAVSQENRDNKSTTIGAGIGGALGGCLVSAVVLLLIRHLKRRNPHPIEPPVSASEDQAKGRLELPTDEPHVELPSQDQLAWELPAEER